MKKLLLSVLITFALAPLAGAETQWEVAVAFFGQQEKDSYQKNVNKNIVQLAQLKPNDNFKVTIMRDLKTHTVVYSPQPKSQELNFWDPLFFGKPMNNGFEFPPIQVPGPMKVWQKPQAPEIYENSEALDHFFKSAFRNPKAKRVLVIYGHGYAFDGFDIIKLKQLENLLTSNLPSRDGNKPLDVLWMDSCFMASTEVASQFEMKDLTKYYVSSQEAEFQLATPFHTFSTLEKGPDDVEATVIDLAMAFIESYSVKFKGDQSSAVYISSATISVIETSKLDYLVDILARFKVATGFLSDDLRKYLDEKYNFRRMVDREDVVDLGTFFRQLKDSELLDDKQIPVVDELLSLIELDKDDSLRTHPRVPIEFPEVSPKITGKESQTQMVYGFNHWNRGDKEDLEIRRKVPYWMASENFVEDEFGMKWPVLDYFEPSSKVPFTVGADVFNYYFISKKTGKIIGEEKAIYRILDFTNFIRRNPNNPILYTGYTHGRGETAERYTGLNLFDPTTGQLGFSYLETHFHLTTEWGSL